MLLSKLEAEKTEQGEAKNGNNFQSKFKGAVMFAIFKIIGVFGGGCF